MKFLKNYSLSILLAVLFFISWMAHFYSGWREFAAKQLANQQLPRLFGDDGFIWPFLSETFQNWQSEFFQTLIFVVFSTYFIHRHSPQSRDSDDEMMRRLKNIEKILEQKKD